MDIPKYAKLEHERRFLVTPGAAPNLESRPFRRIEDRYLTGTRLRLRAVRDSVSGAAEFKFCKKYGSDDPVSEPITNLYLTAAEHAALSCLPAAVITKRRYRIDGFGLDVFKGELEGLMLCESEAPTHAAALALSFPPWAGREVTADPFFSGGNLCGVSAAELAARLRAERG